MSSNNPTQWLSTADIKKLQRVLNEAGYDAKIVVSDDALPSVPASLIVKLFRSGITSPVELAEGLERYFGKHARVRWTPRVSKLHRYAIQGLPPGNGPAV
jgi:hypothetical protein